jgi:hypothetical protein
LEQVQIQNWFKLQKQFHKIFQVLHLPLVTANEMQLYQDLLLLHLLNSKDYRNLLQFQQVNSYHLCQLHLKIKWLLHKQVPLKVFRLMYRLLVK